MLRRLTIPLLTALPLMALGAAAAEGCGKDDAFANDFSRGVFVDDAGGKVCPSVPDTPVMIAVGGWNGVAYCIDTTEVTNAQYRKWLESAPMTTGQRPACSFNTSFLPTTGMPPLDDRPVVNVDFCDAAAFCEGFGKRLCGKVQGGPLDFEAFDDPAESQWQSACSHGGERVFPYGTTYDPNACNGKDSLYAVPLPVGSLPTCVGGTEGLFDMSGNVWEWEDACNPGDAGMPVCRRRGGSYSAAEKYLGCAAPSSRAIDEYEGNLGFRCCSN